MVFILTFVTLSLCDLKDLEKKLLTVVFSGLLLRQRDYLCFGILW